MSKNPKICVLGKRLFHSLYPREQKTHLKPHSKTNIGAFKMHHFLKQESIPCVVKIIIYHISRATVTLEAPKQIMLDAKWKKNPLNAGFKHPPYKPISGRKSVSAAHQGRREAPTHLSPPRQQRLSAGAPVASATASRAELATFRCLAAA